MICYSSMMRACKKKEIGAQIFLCARRRRAIEIIWLLCFCAFVKCGSLEEEYDINEINSDQNSSRLENKSLATKYDAAIEHLTVKNEVSKEAITPDDMLMYGMGAVPAFEEIGRDGAGTTNIQSTSESSLAGLASIGGGFDHVSFEPQYPPSSRTPSTKNQLDNKIQNSTSENPTSPFKEYVNDLTKCGHYTVSKDETGRKTYLNTIKRAKPCRFWAEGVASTVVAIFGFMGNLISIWVLSDDELRSSAFNRLLLSLAIIDCMFIMPGTIIYNAKAFSWEADWYNRSFPVFLYPFTEIALCSSIYMTLAIAVERYIGLCRPFQRLSGSCSAKAYITPVVIIAMLLNIPKFFESETTYRENKETNTTTTSIGVTNLRLHPDYITYYWMWTRLLTTGVIPFLLLALLNSKIYLAIRKSKQQLRALAIRSALPMAILGAKNAAGATAGVSSPDTLVPELAGMSISSSLLSPSTPDNNGHINGHTKRNQPSTGVIPRNHEAPITPSVACNSPPTHDFVKLSPKNIFFIKNGDTSIVNGTPQIKATTYDQQNGSPKSPSSPRYIQRSMSALVDSSNRQIRHSPQGRIGGRDLSTLGRSYSTAATVSHATNNNTEPPSQTLSNYNTNENLAPILFGVVIVFVICNSLRVILNIYDSSVVEDIIECEKKKMGRYPPAWILCTISVSHFLLMVNSSVNFLVYCVAGKRFRSILARKIRNKFRAFRKIILHCCSKEDIHHSYFSHRSQSTSHSTHLHNNTLDANVNGFHDKRHQHRLLLKHISSPDTLLSLQNPQQHISNK